MSDRRSKSPEHLVELLAETALDPSAWNRFCDGVAERFGGEGVLIVGDDVGTRLPHMPHSEGLEEHLVDYVAGGWGQHDLRTQRGFPVAYARGYVTDRDIANDIELARHPFYAEFVVPYGLPWFGATAMRVQNQAWGLSVLRSAEQGPLEPGEFEELAAFRPALATALRRAAVLGGRRVEAVERSFGASHHGVAVIGHSGRILWHNAAADALLAAGGLARNGYLSAPDGRSASALGALVDGALLSPLGAAAPPPVHVALADGRRLVLDIVSMPRDFQSLIADAAAIVTIRQVGHGSDTTDWLRERFGLTPRESEIAAALAGGRALEEISTALGMSVATSRQHLKAIFRKTGTHRQAELVSVLVTA